MTDDDYRQLVEFLGRHFTEIDQQFAVVHRRFEAMDRRFDTIAQRLDGHDERFREMLGHLEAIYGKLDRLEQEYYAIVEGLRRIEMILADERGQRELLERGLAEMKERVALLQARIDELERRLRT
jgi:chromosome segregation ATPase